jgi:hypothetical protein
MKMIRRSPTGGPYVCGRCGKTFHDVSRCDVHTGLCWGVDAADEGYFGHIEVALDRALREWKGTT